MKVILLNPNNITSRNDMMLNSFVGCVPPYALIGIASVIREEGVDVSIIDQYVECKKKEELIERLLNENPDILGISVLTPVFTWVKELCRIIKERLPDVTIVLGNSFSSIYYERILQERIADVVIHGEGEYTFKEYLCAVRDKTSLHEVKGLSFRENDAVVKTPDRALIENLDELPYPAWDLIDFRNYKSIPMLSLHSPAIMIQASRGCTYDCFYCSQDAAFKKFRTRSVTSVVDEIEFLHERYGVSFFLFLDAFFPFSIEHGIQFCDELIKRNLHTKIKWLTETKVDLVNEQLLERMKMAGLHLIMYGFETGSERLLKMINKKTSLKVAYDVMKATKKFNIRTLGLFMLGFPRETKEECFQTIAFSKALGCDLVKYNLLMPYLGTKLYNRYIEDKYLAYDRPELFSSWYTIANKGDTSFNFSNVDTRTLVNIQRRALLSYYVRPSVIYNVFSKGILRIQTVLQAAIFLFINALLIVYSGFKPSSHQK